MPPEWCCESIAFGGQMGKQRRWLAVSRERIAAAAFALALTGCGAAPADAPIPSDAVARDRSAHGAAMVPVGSDRSAPYRELREAAAAMPEAGLDGLRESDEPDRDGDRIFDVIDCEEEFRSVEPQPLPMKEAERETLARRAVLLERGLLAAGYRSDVIAGPLRAYEERALTRIEQAIAPAPDTAPDAWSSDGGDADMAELARELDANRQRLQPGQPPIRAEGGCGAAEQPVLVRSAPAGAKMWLATRFGFAVCRVRRIDAWDRSQCPRWSEVDPDRPAALSGSYMYQARWPDGRTARGNRTVDGAAGIEDGSPAVVTIRPD